MSPLEYLMNLLKQHRDTYSDTPGMGNMDSFQFPQSSLPYGFPNENYDNKFMLFQSMLQKKDAQMSLPERYKLEQMMMDKRLHDLQLDNRMMQKFGNPRPLFNEEHDYRRFGPEEGDDYKRWIMQRRTTEM